MDPLEVIGWSQSAGTTPARKVAEHDRGADPVFVPDERARRITERFLVAEDEAYPFFLFQLEGPVGDPLETGERLLEARAESPSNVAELARRDNGGDDQRPSTSGRRVGEQIVSEQDADLISGERAELAFRIARHHREPVCVGVVGDGQIRAKLFGELAGEVHRPGLLGVWKRDGGE